MFNARTSKMKSGLDKSSQSKRNDLCNSLSRKLSLIASQFFPIASDDLAMEFFVTAPLVSEFSFGIQKL